jgi:hypothetical protein
MQSTTLDHYAVPDSVDGFSGAGPTQVPTCLPPARHHPTYTDFSFIAMPEQISLEQQLRQYEEEARNKYCSTLENMHIILSGI